MSDDLPPFPDLIHEAADQARWPAPPFAWRHLPVPDTYTAQPCRVESLGGAVLDGEMLSFAPQSGGMTFRASADGPEVTLPFVRVRRLTLTTPLRPAPRMAGAPVEIVPSAAQERDYRVHLRGSSTVLSGRTAGHVDTDYGLYLFTPVEDEMSLLRVFVPRSAYVSREFGLSAEEIAAERWIATPQELLAALERQQRIPVLPIGQALLDLGLLTQRQLDRALAQERSDKPLGEFLVATGVVSRHDLQTALAFKMGYPFVDLTRFPLEPEAAQKLPLRLALRARAIPLMLDNKRLIVAVEKPSRAAKLGALQAFTDLTVVPALSSKSQILMALSGSTSNDAWSHNVFAHLPFFPTTS